MIDALGTEPLAEPDLGWSKATVHPLWPMYLVTAAHRVVPKGDDPGPDLPYGDWHARREGSMQTACGRSAVTWTFFWLLDFQAAGEWACPECQRVVDRERISSRSWSALEAEANARCV